MQEKWGDISLSLLTGSQFFSSFRSAVLRFTGCLYYGYEVYKVTGVVEHLVIVVAKLSLLVFYACSHDLLIQYHLLGATCYFLTRSSRVCFVMFLRL